MFGFYVVMGCIAAGALVLILSFVGPEKSESPFWIAVQKTRAVLDKGSYWIICAMAIGFLLFVAVSFLMSLFR